MHQNLFATLNELCLRGESFAVATVIEIEGSGSAKPGSKAVIGADARVLLGWVGGGCVENMIREEAVESIKTGTPRVLSVDLTNEVFGMPCGGMMKVYIDPILPPPQLIIAGHGRIAETLARFGEMVGFSVTVADPGVTPETFPAASRLITEGFSSPDIKIGPNAYVVVATQHKGDHLTIKKAVEGGAAYIALIASKTRAQLVVDYLEDIGIGESRLAETNLRAPAGLDIGAQTPEEIALSVISEIVSVRRGGTGRIMREAKGIQFHRDPDAGCQSEVFGAPAGNSLALHPETE